MSARNAASPGASASRRARRSTRPGTGAGFPARGSTRPRAVADLPARGFTLVELVVVIVIVGVLSAIAMPRFFDDRTFAERAYFEGLVAGLRFARRVAVDSGCPVRFALDAAGWSARQQAAAGGRCQPGDATWPVAVVGGDGEPVAAAAPAGVSAGPPLTVTFDTLGATDLGSNRTVAVGPYSLSLEAASGYVSAN